jgi:hypothetical protein
MTTRRKFIQQSAAVTAAMALRKNLFAQSTETTTTPQFQTDDVVLQKAYDAALELLRGNVMKLPGLDHPVLIEGAVYKGVWLECAPQEGLVYDFFAPGMAQANHDIFFALQRDDGYLPCSVKPSGPGSAQIQTAVPIAATAWDTYQKTKDAAFLQQAYTACSRWDEWLLRYRNTRGTGLTEGFGTYDTGHDNSPRWAGMPRQGGLNADGHADARICAKVDGLPRLCPDLSAATYGGRVALEQMAMELGKPYEAGKWADKAEMIRELILEKLYDPATKSFYDLDSNNQFVKIRGDAMVRVLGEHVVGRKLFAEIADAQIFNPKAFWPAYPLPSIALDDPTFVRPIPRNSWGGASQALTALRAPRWMEFYGHAAELAQMMRQWVSAISQAGGFYQQLDPLDGKFTITDGSGYSPCALTLLDYTWRLYGVREERDYMNKPYLQWNCGENTGAMTATSSTAKGMAVIDRKGSTATLTLAGKKIAVVTGTVRLNTTLDGKWSSVEGVSGQTERVTLHHADRAVKSIHIKSNEKKLI